MSIKKYYINIKRENERKKSIFYDTVQVQPLQSVFSFLKKSVPAKALDSQSQSAAKALQLPTLPVLKNKLKADAEVDWAPKLESVFFPVGLKSVDENTPENLKSNEFFALPSWKKSQHFEEQIREQALKRQIFPSDRQTLR